MTLQWEIKDKVDIKDELQQGTMPEETDKPEEKLNAKEAMEYLDITHTTFYRRLADKQLPIPYHQHKAKRDKYFYKSELDDYVEQYNEAKNKKKKETAE